MLAIWRLPPPTMTFASSLSRMALWTRSVSLSAATPAAAKALDSSRCPTAPRRKPPSKGSRARSSRVVPSRSMKPSPVNRVVSRAALAGLPARAARLTTRFTGLGFIDREGTTLELLALEPLDGGFRRGAVGHLDESKAFAAAGVAADNDTDLVHNAIRLKELAKVMVGGGKRQIANINIHGRFLVGNGTHNRQVIRTVCRSKRCKSKM